MSKRTTKTTMTECKFSAVYTTYSGFETGTSQTTNTLTTSLNSAGFKAAKELESLLSLTIYFRGTATVRKIDAWAQIFWISTNS